MEDDGRSLLSSAIARAEVLASAYAGALLRALARARLQSITAAQQTFEAPKASSARPGEHYEYVALCARGSASIQ